MKTDMTLFEDYQIRRVYDEKAEIWWFSVIDIVQVLTQQVDYQAARKYWNKLKQRLSKEGSQLVTDCHQLKMTAPDGKQRFTDVATAQPLLRLVQSVPNPKTEPNKLCSGNIAQNVRKKLETKTNYKVISSENYLLPGDKKCTIKNICNLT